MCSWQDFSRRSQHVQGLRTGNISRCFATPLLRPPSPHCFTSSSHHHVSLETSDQDEEIDDLGPGQYFNLKALLEDGATGIATYHAKTNCSCFVLERSDLAGVVTGDFRSLATKAYHARLAEVNSAINFVNILYDM